MSAHWIIEEGDKYLKISFPSRLSELDDVVARGVMFAEEHKLGLDMFGLKLVMYESLMNAVRHGNKMQESLFVDLSFVFDENVLTITVSDRGDGFDWRRQINNEMREENLTGGRGIIILKMYDYNPSYNDMGNQLVLRKLINMKGK